MYIFFKEIELIYQKSDPTVLLNSTCLLTGQGWREKRKGVLLSFSSAALSASVLMALLDRHSSSLPSVMLSAAKNLSRPARRFFAALSMTGELAF